MKKIADNVYNFCLKNKWMLVRVHTFGFSLNLSATKIHINPFYKFIFSFIGGILIGFHSPVSLSLERVLMAIITLSCVLFILQFIRRISWHFLGGICVNALFVCAGTLLWMAHQPNYQAKHLVNSYKTGTQIEGYISSLSSQTPYFYRFNLTATHLIEDQSKYNTSGELVVYLSKEITEERSLYPGKKMLIAQPLKEINPPKQTGDFNYKAYLANKGIFHQVFVKNPSKIFILKDAHRSLKILALKAQKQLLEKLQASIDVDENFSIGAALLLGYKKHIDDQTYKAFQYSGAMHVLAVSGLHVGIVFFFLLMVFSLFGNGRKRQIVRYIIIMILLWIYAFITGLSPSVCRAVTMFSLYGVGKIFNRQVSVVNIVLCSAFILLLIRPHYLFDIGFQLSYAAVFGIVYFYPIFKAWFTPKFGYAWLNKGVRYLWNLTCVSLAAQLATLPLSMYYFGIFPKYSLLTNLIVIPLVSIILSVGLCFFASVFIYEPIADFLGDALNTFLLWLNESTKVIMSFPGCAVTDISYSISTIVILFMGLVCLYYILAHRDARFFLGGLALVFVLLTQQICVSMGISIIG